MYVCLCMYVYMWVCNVSMYISAGYHPNPLRYSSFNCQTSPIPVSPTPTCRCPQMSGTPPGRDFNSGSGDQLFRPEFWSSSVAVSKWRDSSLNQATATSRPLLVFTNRYVSVKSLYAAWQLCATCWLALRLAEMKLSVRCEWLVNSTVIRTEGENKQKAKRRKHELRNAALTSICYRECVEVDLHF
jgi:hypothetical protein